jgi:hypothetical protein
MVRLIFMFLVAFIGMIWFISCQKEITCEDCNKQNKTPIAIAGADQLIRLPANIVTLDGSASSDQDGNIILYRWRKISGPSAFNIVGPSDSITVVNNLVFGIYQFELEVKDNVGLSAKDTIMITVDNSNQSNRPPVADAGADQIITLPIQTFSLDGSASSDPDNNISGYTWSKISGPPSFSITDTSAMITQATALQEGLYLFELTVTDSAGLKDIDTVTVNVNPGNNSTEVDIYIAGGNGAPKYWKNGQEVLLFPDLAGDDLASSIAVVGNDVYVAGDNNEWPYGDNSWPRYWWYGLPMVTAMPVRLLLLLLAMMFMYRGLRISEQILWPSTGKTDSR